MEFLKVRAKFPGHISFFAARMLINGFVTDSLENFKIAPTNEQLQTYINSRYHDYTCDTYYCVMIELTPEEAMNTVSSRSMSSYEAPVQKRKLETQEKRNLKNFRKKRKDETSKDEKCEICQENLSKHVYTVPCCQSSFHGACIRKALTWRDTCPMCYQNLANLLAKTETQN